MPVTDLVAPREWPSLGWEVIDFIETYLVHGPGDVMGEPIELDNELGQFILDAYRIYPQGHAREGRRAVRYAGLSLPKGRAKSELAGMLVCAEFIGPVRFSHWAEDGSPVGKRVKYPMIRLLATEEGQVGNTYLNVMAMLEHAKELAPKAFADVMVGATRIFLGRNGRDGEIRPCTAGSASKDGGKESFAVADEVHLYLLPQLHDMHTLVRQNCGKRKDAQPWMLATTTMFAPGELSVAEEVFEEADRLGSVDRQTYGFMFHHRQGYPVTSPDDDEAILESLEESYGPACDFIDTENILENQFRAPGAEWSKNVRYFLNLKHKGENKAIASERWDSLADARRNDLTGKRIVLWFDGSEKGRGGDHTVLGAWTVEEKPHCVLLDWWGPEKQADGEWRIDRRKVRNRVAELAKQLNVVRLVADPHKWIEQLDMWSDDFGDGLDGDPIVLSFDTSKPTRMGPAVDRMLEAVDECSFTHDGSPQLRYYALNALLAKAKGSGDYHALIKEKEDRKIDGLVGAVIGYDELRNVPVTQPLAPIAVWA